MKKPALFVVLTGLTGCALAFDWDIDGAPIAKDAGKTEPDASTPLSDADPPDTAASDAGRFGKVVFVTSETFVGNLERLEGANRKCNALASAGDAGVHPRVVTTGLQDRAYFAWLSRDGITVLNRALPDAGPYMLPSGKVIAATFADLLDGTIDIPITEDEKGNPVTSGLVWTGTLTDGNAAAETCGNNWQSSDGDGHVGNLTATDGRWTSETNMPCSTPLHLYCFEQ